MRFVFSVWHPSGQKTIDLDKAYIELRGTFDPEEEHWARIAEIEPVVPPYAGGDSFDGWIVLPVMASPERLRPRRRRLRAARSIADPRHRLLRRLRREKGDTHELRPIRAYIVFTGTGPILVLSTYPELTDERLVSKLRYKGIDKFIAYEVDLDAVRDALRATPSPTISARSRGGDEDLRVLDFNGHQIMANFSLEELGEPIKFGD